MEIDPKRLDELIAAAEAARRHAYAPYSGFAVGAAVLDEAGAVSVGCNVENASYGLTMCAERAALFAAMAAGAARVVAVAVVVDGETASPCGACRQVMTELCPPGATVAQATTAGARRLSTVASLLPSPFTASDLGLRPRWQQ